MKKIAVLFATVALLCSATAASAEGLIFKGGVTYTQGTKLKDVDIKGYTGWHFGAGFQTESFAGFTFQPELLYKVKGVSLEDATSVRMNYIEIPVNIQWGADLLVARPFIFAAPFVGVNLSTKFSREATYAETLSQNIKKLECGFGAGAGVEVGKIQVTVKYNWNFGNVADWSSYKASLKDVRVATGTLEAGVALKF